MFFFLTCLSVLYCHLTWLLHSQKNKRSVVGVTPAHSTATIMTHPHAHRHTHIHTYTSRVKTKQRDTKQYRIKQVLSALVTSCLVGFFPENFPCSNTRSAAALHKNQSSHISAPAAATAATAAAASHQAAVGQNEGRWLPVNADSQTHSKSFALAFFFPLKNNWFHMVPDGWWKHI